jgi:hypothetical protein
MRRPGIIVAALTVAAGRRQFVDFRSPIAVKTLCRLGFSSDAIVSFNDLASRKRLRQGDAGVVVVLCVVQNGTH